MRSLIEVNAAFPWFFPTVVFVLGAVTGSFLNVCIYRIPVGKSIIHPGSTCACGRPIAWYDNIPILSWIILRGHARCCGRTFSVRYPAIELLTAVLFLLCWLQHPPIRAAAGMVFTGMLICATFIDFDHMIIPDRFSIGTAVVGVALATLLPVTGVPLVGDSLTGVALVDAVRGLVTSMIGVLIGSGVVLWIGLLAEVLLRKEAMGFGDVKLVGAIGAFCGWQGAVFSVFGGAVIGTMAFAVVLLLHGLFGRKPVPPEPGQSAAAAESSEEESSPSGAMGLGVHTPFGPMLSAGALVYFLWLGPTVNTYFATITQMLFTNF